MFTSLGRTDRRRLCIFYSDRLLSDVWTPHPVNEQRLYEDRPFTGGRGAGPFIERDGTLLRPAQDNPHYYGESLVLNEVRVLSEDRFEEVPTRRMPYHHLCEADGVTVVDFRDRTAPFPLRREAGRAPEAACDDDDD